MSPSARIRSLAAVIASISVVGIAFGLNMPLLSLVLESRHVDSTIIGLNAAVQAVSTVVATPFIPRLMFPPHLPWGGVRLYSPVSDLRRP